MLKKIVLHDQLSLYQEQAPLMYMTQADVAKHLGVTSRMIQYWHKEDLLHPELEVRGRSRRYTQNDLVELKFIKEMVVDRGYSIPSLKEKLKSLAKPYYYDASDSFWDVKDGTWKTGNEIALEILRREREKILEVAQSLMVEAGLPWEEKSAQIFLGVVVEGLSGSLKQRRRQRKRAPKDFHLDLLERLKE